MEAPLNSFLTNTFPDEFSLGAPQPKTSLSISDTIWGPIILELPFIRLPFFVDKTVLN